MPLEGDDLFDLGKLEHDTLEHDSMSHPVQLLKPKPAKAQAEEATSQAVIDQQRDERETRDPEDVKRLGLKAAKGRLGKPWLHPDNPAIWEGDVDPDDY
jgi:hypothetical protein